jgi:hypothetical protein
MFREPEVHVRSHLVYVVVIVVRDGHVEPALVVLRFPGHLQVKLPDFWITPGAVGIGRGFGHTLALLQLDLGHVWAPGHLPLAGVAQAKNHIAHPAAGFFQKGVELDLHVRCILLCILFCEIYYSQTIHRSFAVPSQVRTVLVLC